MPVAPTAPLAAHPHVEYRPTTSSARMGCSIRMVLERNIHGRWVGLHHFDPVPRPNDDDVYWEVTLRNYRLFTRLANVRGEGGPPPRGLPDDISELARYYVDTWGGDGHSHTWFTLDEALPLFAAEHAPAELLTEARVHICYRLFGVDDSETGIHRLIIWFDN